ncbi:MAG: hypothetical protein WDN07_04425 [Actinomycetota bacterium]
MIQPTRQLLFISSKLDTRLESFKISLKYYDDATATAGAWDAGQCAQNAQAHVANKAEVAVIGTLQLRLRQD